MKILIDARFYGLENAGIGRYVMKLLESLQGEDKKNEYVIFLRKKYFDKLSLAANFKKVLVDIPHYSLEEQIKLPSLIRSQKPDICHFPHFNIPIFYQGKFVVTIHDLIKHTSRGTSTTTRTPWLYLVKYLGYKVVFKKAVRNACKIIVPSQAIKNELGKTYGVPAQKVVAIYEGVEEKFRPVRQDAKILTKYGIVKPFVIYTGSVYPHKNIERLLGAIKLVNSKHDLMLVISCARSVFWGRLEKKIKEIGVGRFANLAGFIPDEDLVLIYSQASAFVFPSFSEGFGLPGLEAMAAGLPVVCSDIPVLREVYAEAALFFDPHDPKDMAEKILKMVSNGKLRNELIKKGTVQSQKYSWGKMARQTLKVYNRWQ